jgi:hypothetical protein
LRANPILAWTQEHYEKPIVVTTSPFGRSAVVCDPDAIRRILVENVANYRKDLLQKRLLCPALANGLLTSEGNDWREQGRRFAPHSCIAWVARARRLKLGLVARATFISDRLHLG